MSVGHWLNSYRLYIPFCFKRQAVVGQSRRNLHQTSVGRSSNMSSFLTFHVPPSELGKKLPHLQTLSSDTAAPEAGLDSSAAPFTDGFRTGEL